MAGRTETAREGDMENGEGKRERAEFAQDRGKRIQLIIHVFWTGLRSKSIQYKINRLVKLIRCLFNMGGH